VVIKGLVFDLDDTLSDERDYVRSGFDCVAHAAARSDAEAARLADWMWAAFESGVRGDTFDRLLAAFPDLGARLTTDDLIAAYRNHVPAIELAPGVAELLDALRTRDLRLGVLTDGPSASQSAKAAALQLDRWFDPIVLTDTLGPGFAKPSPDGFALISRRWGVPGRHLGYVADNPEKDFVGPRQLGWATVRLRRPTQLRFALEPADAAFAADIELDDPAAIIGWLESSAAIGSEDQPGA
jgi:putative hydrolase of the HAD superfamily